MDDNALQKKKIFFIKDFFSKPDQICREFRIWPHLLKESLMKNFIFYAVMNERGIKCSNFPWRTLEIFKREVKLEHPFTDFVCKLWKYTFYGAWKDTSAIWYDINLLDSRLQIERVGKTVTVSRSAGKYASVSASQYVSWHFFSKQLISLFWSFTQS